MTSTQNLTTSTTAFDLAAYLTDRQPRVEAALDAAIRPAYPDTIYAAMRYSLLV
jgi:geranylgeranyl diphosphate synthase, type II